MNQIKLNIYKEALSKLVPTLMEQESLLTKEIEEICSQKKLSTAEVIYFRL